MKRWTKEEDEIIRSTLTNALEHDNFAIKGIKEAAILLDRSTGSVAFRWYNVLNKGDFKTEKVVKEDKPPIDGQMVFEYIKSLENEVLSLKFQLTESKEELNNFLTMIEKARKMAFVGEPTKFKMDSNGNLEKFG